MLKLGFDLDGVLANFTTTMARKLGHDVSEDWVPDDYWWENHLGLSESYIKAVKDREYNSGHFWLDLPAYEENVDALRHFQWDVEEPVQYYFCTDRKGKDVQDESIGWLEDHSLKGSVIITPEKGKLAQVLNLDFYIDDNWDNAASILHFTGKRGYLLDKPYNRGLGDESKVIRVQTVEKYLNDIRGFVKIL